MKTGIKVRSRAGISAISALRRLSSAPRGPLTAGMEVREAKPEGAQRTCAVIRRSIIELCVADHGHDPARLAASFLRRPGRLRISTTMISSSHPLERVADAVVLRPLTLSDAPVAAGVIRTAFAAQSKATRPPSSALRETQERVAAKIAAGGGFGAYARGELVAAAIWAIDKDALHVGRVSTLPAYRGLGVAAALIAACERAARAHGLKRLTLRARLELPENERLFQRLGFVRVGVEAHEGFDAPTTAVMEKRFS